MGRRLLPLWIMSGKALPERMCVICRRRFAKPGLTRHVLDAHGHLVEDTKGLLPGRGWYVCADPVCQKKFTKFSAVTRRRKERIAGVCHQQM